MIRIEQVKRYCSNYEQIENYQEAINSPEKYDCHHRLEETGLSKKDLIGKNMYYNRPASELIFLLHGNHMSLHNKGNKNMLGKHHSIEAKKKLSDALKGKVVSDETRKKLSEVHKGRIFSDETRKKMSKNHADFSGSKNPRYKFICPALLQMMYIEQGKSIKQIAKESGISQPVIRRRLRELNISIRKNSYYLTKYK